MDNSIARRVPGLAAVVLCGGESSRMGRPKAWLPFGGEPLCARVVRRLAEVAWPIVVVAAPDQSLPPLPEAARIARDSIAGQGPLQGLLAGLDALPPEARSIFLASTDAPFLCAALVRCLETLRSKPEYDAVVPQVAGRVQPLASVIGLRPSAGSTLRDLVADRLARRDLRLRALFDDLRTRLVTEADLLADDALRAADPSLRSFRNLNTPEDYEAALRDSGLEGAFSDRVE